MITHILKDGTKTNSISGIVISSKEFPVIYKILEEGQRRHLSDTQEEGDQKTVWADHMETQII